MNDFEMRDLFEQVQTMELRLKALEGKGASECCKEEQMAYKTQKNKNGVPRKKPKKRRIKKGEKASRGRDGKIRRKK